MFCLYFDHSGFMRLLLPLGRAEADVKLFKTDLFQIFLWFLSVKHKKSKKVNYCNLLSKIQIWSCFEIMSLLDWVERLLRLSNGFDYFNSLSKVQFNFTIEKDWGENAAKISRRNTNANTNTNTNKDENSNKNITTN